MFFLKRNKQTTIKRRSCKKELRLLLIHHCQFNHANQSNFVNNTVIYFYCTFCFLYLIYFITEFELKIIKLYCIILLSHELVIILYSDLHLKKEIHFYIRNVFD